MHENDHSPLKHKRVVVVEDEGIILAHLCKILTTSGMEVVGKTFDGPSAVEISLHENPDLVLMDIDMPGGFDGLEATRRILGQKRLCIVIVSGISDSLDREQALQIGACGYVTKPVSRDTLLPELEVAYARCTATS